VVVVRIEPSYEEVKQIYQEYMTTIRLDFENGALLYKDIPIILSRAALLYNIFTEMYNLLGESVIAIMHRIGKPYGESFYKIVSESFKMAGIEGSIENHYRYICAETASIGWGRIAIEDDGNAVKIICKRGFPVGRLSVAEGKVSTYPMDAYFLGYFEGYLSLLHRKDMKGREVECVGKGDERCLMVFE